LGFLAIAASNRNASCPLPSETRKSIEAYWPFQLSEDPNFLQTQPNPQIHIALSRLVIPNPYGQGPVGTHHDHQFLSPGNRRINQIALQEHTPSLFIPHRRIDFPSTY
jgi:hypothetical protein